MNRKPNIKEINLMTAAVVVMGWIDEQAGVKPAIRLALMAAGIVAAMQSLPLIVGLLGASEMAVTPAVTTLF